MMLIGVLISIILAWAAGPRPAFAAGSPNAQDLASCFQDLAPFTTTGSRAAVYPKGSAWIFIPGSYTNQDGLWIYGSSGASFAAIDPSMAGKVVAFEISGEKGRQTVIYQPSGGGHGPRIWLRPAGSYPGTGVTLLFSSADDPEKRAPLEAELATMVRGMTQTWDEREQELVKAVNDGRYLWVDVDVDDYSDSAGKCAKLLDDVPETAPLRSAIRSEVADLTRQAQQTGVIHDAHASSFMTSPQY